MYFVDKDYSKKSSGARFFSSMESELKKFPEYSKKKYKYVLINISTPLKKFLIYKFLNKKIILRVDGNYSYPITKGSINASNCLIVFIFNFLNKMKRIHPILKKLAKNNMISFIFNLQFNISNYLKIYFSNLVIYQSSFSLECHKNIFPKKNYKIIHNSSPWKFIDLPFIKYGTSKVNKKSNSIKICTSFHKDRPLKGFGDLLIDLEEIRNQNNETKIDLHIFGYVPNCVIKTYSKKIIDADEFININKSWISVSPSFSYYSKKLSKSLISSDVYITYAQLDPCPNIVLEALSHGLPIIGCKSGGIPEIIKGCGEILPIENSTNTIYQNLNFEYGLNPPKKIHLYEAIIKIKNNQKAYRANIKKILETTFSNENSVSAYHKLLKNLTFNN